MKNRLGRFGRALGSRPRTAAIAVVVAAACVAVGIAVVRSRHERPTFRRALFAELRPERLANCTFERFGERYDGGYLLCANLLGDVRAGYSYGINGYDGWGCDVSRRLRVVVHEYDCFNTRVPVCRGGRTRFHDECVAEWADTESGRRFDSVEGQVSRNGDEAKRIVLKMDVEGAEWGALLTVPDATLERIDQMNVEFHGVDERWALEVLGRLKRFFHIVHVHFNNHSCRSGIEPFPSSVYEVLFVSRRLGRIDHAATALAALHLIGPMSSGPTAPNDPGRPDCQAWQWP